MVWPYAGSVQATTVAERSCTQRLYHVQGILETSFFNAQKASGCNFRHPPSQYQSVLNTKLVFRKLFGNITLHKGWRSFAMQF